MKIALFGGAFDPVHREHVRLAEAAVRSLRLDKLIVMPSCISPHKTAAHTPPSDRAAMCRLAFRDVEGAEVSDYELNAGGKSFSYLTCREFARRYPDAERFFLVGADMLASFPSWREPQEIVRCVTLAACGRGKEGTAGLKGDFRKRFGAELAEIPFTGEDVSSTALRTALAFRSKTEVGSLSALDGEVLRYIEERGLYRYPEAERALDLETEERKAHSYRVARLACAVAREVGIAEEKALLAAMLHDCGKSVPLGDPMLKGLSLPEGTPAPVVHQYSGAFLAKERFGVRDEEILGAIACHTTGRAGMGTLDKLLYLSDLLEEGRTFRGVEELRALLFEDLDECLYEALRQQIEYLRSTGKEVCPLTEEAFLWLSAQRNLKS